MNARDSQSWQSNSPEALAAALSRELQRGLPGRAAYREMVPELAYGRHCGPVPDAARRAAVLVSLHWTEFGWAIPAMLRPVTMRAHADQVSLPGGVIEHGETAVATALREFEEELGAQAGELQVLGALTPVFVFISNFEVTPIVAISPQPLEFHPNMQEVAAVVELHLSRLIDPTIRGSHLIRRQQLAFRVPHFAIAGHQVWGATSLILAEFARLIERIEMTE